MYKKHLLGLALIAPLAFATNRLNFGASIEVAAQQSSGQTSPEVAIGLFASNEAPWVIGSYHYTVTTTYALFFEEADSKIHIGAEIGGDTRAMLAILRSDKYGGYSIGINHRLANIDNTWINGKLSCMKIGGEPNFRASLGASRTFFSES
ncbi:hypothetical protein [Candidatus Synchoanobacter obligatus]|uniref:Uncharacterized protein n=1 Tax=Candidatus Synchoanobacter obligatus TaxID=2919597 RepID=A0ABT1L4S7_9GAMM|nr:hypothetical protein [Candidatus Synchoanobacter obligatus]MCP8352166.1 hypothetical protein [Candidatus Synchoanobacter obligatus]